MARLIWSPSALADADSIAEFIAKDAPITASLFVRKLFSAAQILIDHPEIGRMIPELGNSERRENLFWQVSFMYRIENIDVVRVVGIIHGSRNMGDSK